ncbi:hypothetical protein SAMN04487967_3508 [Natronorubrum sediminis]|uniref:Uncharacterized protein n=1 Tax=Natronorubrum sediminis TaxID=640943 RepID=A0A1H6G4K1_9EURY|nr:hypothetical protein [Natronorubrum sediminis]SEH17979.1 hypothetical protein SAMN04487967_3508 [Natronorubrum sediminis]
MSDSDSDADDADAQQAKRLRSVYLSVTDGDTDPVVEPQQEDSKNREISEDRVNEAVGPAELHGLDDAIDDPEPAD